MHRRQFPFPSQLKPLHCSWVGQVPGAVQCTVRNADECIPNSLCKTASLAYRGAMRIKCLAQGHTTEDSNVKPVSDRRPTDRRRRQGEKISRGLAKRDGNLPLHLMSICPLPGVHRLIHLVPIWVLSVPHLMSICPSTWCPVVSFIPTLARVVIRATCVFYFMFWPLDSR